MGVKHSHLMEPQDVPHGFVRGDLVRIYNDLDIVKALQKGHGEWCDGMEDTIGQTGRVQLCLGHVVRVKVKGNVLSFNPAALKKMASDDGDRELVDSAENGDLTAVKDRLQRCDKQVNKLVNGRNALHVAAANGHVEVLRFLLDNGGRVEIGDENGDKAIHYAVRSDEPDSVNVLIQHGADANSKDVQGKTPLHISVKKGFTATVRSLLAKEIDINSQDSEGNTPLHFAVLKERHNIFRLLIEKGADITLNNKDGLSIWHLAAKYGNLKAMQSMLTKTLESSFVDNKKEDGFTALHLAVLNNHLDVVKFLVEKCKANVDVQNNELLTPLMLAVGKRDATCVEILVDAGCDVNAQDEDGDTALHYILGQHVVFGFDVLERLMKVIDSSNNKAVKDIVRLLLVNGANTSLKNKKGQTPLEVCEDPVLRQAVVKFRRSVTK